MLKTVEKLKLEQNKVKSKMRFRAYNKGRTKMEQNATGVRAYNLKHSGWSGCGPRRSSGDRQESGSQVASLQQMVNLLQSERDALK